MSARAIWEATGKRLISGHLADPKGHGFEKCRLAVFDENTSWEELIEKEPWLQTEVNSSTKGSHPSPILALTVSLLDLHRN